MMVFCDSYGCMFIDECGFCDCDKLNIVGGICESSYHSGRNVMDNEPYRIENKSRWFELFGTPERAARTWINYNGILYCADCPMCHDERGVTCEIPGDCVWEDREHGYDALLEWLKGDV